MARLQRLLVVLGSPKSKKKLILAVRVGADSQRTLSSDFSGFSMLFPKFGFDCGSGTGEEKRLLQNAAMFCFRPSFLHTQRQP
jgi:hypothetical protein